jgi:hypothetical protein
VAAHRSIAADTSSSGPANTGPLRATTDKTIDQRKYDRLTTANSDAIENSIGDVCGEDGKDGKTSRYQLRGEIVNRCRAMDFFGILAR